MKGGNDEVVTWRDGETAMRSDVGAEVLTGAETFGPASLLQREKDRKRGWGTGKSEGVGGAGGEDVLVAWASGLVVGGADESRKRRDDDLGRRRDKEVWWCWGGWCSWRGKVARLGVVPVNR
jgi:hypothetical protein